MIFMSKPNKSKAKIFVVSGSVGAGKDTILRAIYRRRSDLYWAKTTTTRQPRPGETQGNPYYFISKSAFQDLIAQDKLFEYENVYADHYFGMTKSEIKQALKQDQNIIWQIDYRGYNTIKRKYKNLFQDRLVSIFILPPSIKVAEQRIRQRSQLPEKIIKERLELAKKEIQAGQDYDYTVINKQGRLNLAIDDILAIIDQETGIETR
ncbi:MAG: guanylate kinase [Candidatus Moranbacteria bacterium]|nr:guanylate kinase [Candidatus Moranbacteria bacterium]